MSLSDSLSCHDSSRWTKNQQPTAETATAIATAAATSRVSRERMLRPLTWRL